ncbi:PhzF family phenazine biosynthesis protein [Christiangramia salexigens]|uniref:Isomerase n=1 Tax=Christiangramia salexigens TaxID=1913577 RepID=A0A1L3J415_9FLAO|nr:PhzF family phenazine biosynthesis protein [Christiangramia salexigens]APG59889.1 isomerase [Christiangramia salexigens]
MAQKIYQVDAFTNKLFSGNPAAVCPLDKWPDDELLQKIAMENNLAETAFYVKKSDIYEIRWFTPTVEVDLCGHATLATAYVIFNHQNHFGKSIDFYSHRSGNLKVEKEGDLLHLNFPCDSLKEIKKTEAFNDCFNIAPQRVLKGKTDYIFVYEQEDQILNMLPNLTKIAELDARGVIITAPGNKSDFVSRFFAPQSGINEDPVTGSAHTSLTPFWAEQIGRNKLSAIQLSERRGYLRCELLGERVRISGEARLYLAGEISIS